MVLLFAVVIVAILPNFSVAIQETATTIMLATVLCTLGVIIGNVVTRAFGFPWRDAFTNGIEIGIQNLATALLIGVTILERTELAIYPAVYSVISPLIALLAVLVYKQLEKRSGEAVSV